MKFERRLARRYRVAPGEPFRLRDWDPGDTAGLDYDKHDAEKLLKKGIERLTELQEKLYAQDHWAVLLDLPGDGRGRQGRHDQARHVRRQPAGLPGLLVQGALGRGAGPRLPLAHARSACPSAAASASSTARYYEEVLVVRVHPELLDAAAAPAPARRRRTSGRSATRTSTRFERYLARNGMVVRKFFLHVSQEEQKKRFLERLDEPDKNWKFSAADVGEREHWDDYMQRLRGHDPRHARRSGRPGTSSPPTTSGSRGWSSRRRSWPRSKISTSRIPRSARRSGGSLRGFGGQSRGPKALPSPGRRRGSLRLSCRSRRRPGETRRISHASRLRSPSLRRRRARPRSRARPA